MSASKQVLIFDGDCAFCSSSARLLRRMTNNKIAIEPYQKLDLGSLGLTSELTSKAVYFVSGSKRFVAAAAIAQALIESKTIWALAGWLLKLPVVRNIAKPIYYLVAANRHRLPGGTPECQMP
ncbi:MAG: DCC1-like thiol-disulfide oxidoreductase family protein [Aquiluna sp.]|jgi:predicted DCC family thiol-disulfide oxidoreductase YuxK|nr:DCC1-like thiol-disulfide oxidoreductase family protein [Aquiluna sp.]